MTCLNKETPRFMLVPLDKSVTKMKNAFGLGVKVARRGVYCMNRKGFGFRQRRRVKNIFFAIPFITASYPHVCRCEHQGYDRLV